MSIFESRRTAGINTFYPRRRVRAAGTFAVAMASVILIVGFVVSSYILTPVHLAAVSPIPDATPSSWIIEGALTEACTCDVPCTCNFGEGPSPHDYCYALYSYDIRKGRYNDVVLDGLRFGAADMKSGRTLFIDEHATDLQREALRVIIARVILRASPETAAAKAKEKAKDIRYVAIKQEYDNRRTSLDVKGIGEFSANYIMGLDKSQPLVVRNNTTWRIHDAIKAKTIDFHVKIGKDKVNTKNTNSNQGEFEYTDKLDFGSPVEWSCGMTSHSKSHSGKREVTCGM